MRNNSLFYSGVVWCIASLASFTYAILGLLNVSIIGVEELVAFTQSVDPLTLYTTAFIVMTIEGLYIVSAFIPGSTLVLVAAIASQSGGTKQFAVTIFVIFCGWMMSSIVNLTAALLVRDKITKIPTDLTLKIKDRPFLTLLPSFRASYEVAQLMSGIPFWSTLYSTLRVKLFASLAVALLAFVWPLFFDINNISNEEGFVTVFITGLILLAVGVFQIKKAKKQIS